MKRLLSFSLLAGLLATATLLTAEEAASAPEVRLRDNLRATTLQLRTAQNDLAAAVAARDALTAEKTAVEAELEKLKKQLVADRIDNDKVVAALKTTAGNQAAELASTIEELAKTRASLAKVVDYARKLETERNALTVHVSELDRTVEDQRTKNVALYTVGKDILNRYAKFSFGDALDAREPFIGLTRVKLENLIQADREQLADGKIKP